MSYHVTRIKSIVYRKTEELLENLKSELKHPEGNLVDIRECEVRLGEHRFTMLRCFVNARDSGVFVNVGWVVNDHMDQCLLCRSFFSFFNRRHHCRACGTLVCKTCSPHNAFIITMEQFGMMKVCRECYRGQGEPVPVLNTRHLGRSLKPQPKGQPANASSSKPAAGSQSSAISVPSTPATSPAVPPGAASKPSSGNKAANNAAEIRERAESDSYLAPPPYLSEFPLPGYVVKTRRYATNEKVFINICHHPSILDPMLSLFNVVLPPDDVTMQEEEQRVRINQQYRDITAASSLDSTIVPILYLNEDPDATQDKGGASSVLYWVMISSEYFKTSTLKYTSVAVVQKVIEAINKTFQDSLLEDEYVRPRVKGGMKAGAKTCHPLSASMPAPPVATVNTGADAAMASFPSCPVTFLAPIRFMLNTVDVALLLRIQQGAVDARVSMSDNRSVYTERTADDLELAREEDEAEQKKRFRLFFNPLPPFPRFAKKQSSSSSLSTMQMADNASEVSDLTFVSYNPRGGSGGKLPKASSASRLPPIPDSPHAAGTQKTVANGTQSHNGGGGGMSSSASVTGSVNGDGAAGGKRFGWLATQADAKFGPNGRELLTASMLVYQKELSLTEAEVATMMAQASKLPAVLMGWQIKLEIPSSVIDDDAASVAGGSSYQAPPTLSALGHVPTPTWMIFVVTGIRKNAMRKTEFRISSLLREDQWILLKRSQHKVGYDFTPLRQVLSFPK